MRITPLRPVQQTTYRSVGGSVLALASEPVVVTGATADSTAQAETGATATVGTDVAVSGATAGCTVTAYPGTAVLGSDGAILVTGATAEVTAGANAGSGQVATSAPGDMWESPTVITSPSGSPTWSTGDYTKQTTEPVSTSAFYRSRWFSFSVQGTVTFTASAASSVLLEVFDVGGDLGATDGWPLVFSGTGTSVVASNVLVSPTSPIYVRVAAVGDSTFSPTLTWSTEADIIDDSPAGTGSLLQVLDPEVPICPGSVTFSMYNLPEEATVSIRISPDPFGWGNYMTVLADEEGVVLAATAELDGDLPAGTYQLIGEETNGLVASDSFQVLTEPDPAPTADPVDDAPPAGPVARWTLHDPAGDLADFTFTYNPERMTSPWAPRTYTAESTTAPTGQPIVWEAMQRAVEWEFAGYLDTEADLETLSSWLALNKRFYLIDHRQRNWVVTFTSYDPQPKRVIGKPYAHTYTIKALIYEGPVSP